MLLQKDHVCASHPCAPRIARSIRQYVNIHTTVSLLPCVVTLSATRPCCNASLWTGAGLWCCFIVQHRLGIQRRRSCNHNWRFLVCLPPVSWPWVCQDELPHPSYYSMVPLAFLSPHVVIRRSYSSGQRTHVHWEAVCAPMCACCDADNHTDQIACWHVLHSTSVHANCSSKLIRMATEMAAYLQMRLRRIVQSKHMEHCSV